MDGVVERVQNFQQRTSKLNYMTVYYAELLGQYERVPHGAVNAFTDYMYTYIYGTSSFRKLD